MANINNRLVVSPYYGRQTVVITNLTSPIIFFADMATYPTDTKLIYQNFGGELKENVDLDILALGIIPSVQLALIESGASEADAMAHFLNHSVVELSIGGRFVFSEPLRTFTPQSVFRAPVSGGYIADIKDFYDKVPFPAPATQQSGELMTVTIYPAPGLALATLANTGPHAPNIEKTMTNGQAHHIQCSFNAIQYADTAGKLMGK